MAAYLSENEHPNVILGMAQIASSQPSLISEHQRTCRQHSPRQRTRRGVVYDGMSPTKRRRFTPGEERSALGHEAKEYFSGLLQWIAAPCDAALKPAKAPHHSSGLVLLSRADWHVSGPVNAGLHQAFLCLGGRDIADKAVRVCKLWHEIGQSESLWCILRKTLPLKDQVTKVEKITERRSKGKLLKCQRLGFGNVALLRIVNLECTNAGRDDGLPTSFLREAALLSNLHHANVVAFFGAEVTGKEALMCTEYVYQSFAVWFTSLQAKAPCERLMGIQSKFQQVLKGLAYIHGQGVMHRNLKPDNIFITKDGVVKLGDFTSTRMLDISLQCYTPEDPKERDGSGREMRRLWYRAPELILRDDFYGPKVDIWSVGCLIAEAATGQALFPADSEIDFLFRAFRLIGTPTMSSWPEAVTMKNFSSHFPLYSKMCFSDIVNLACHGRSSSVKHDLYRDRSDILQHMLNVADVLRPNGMFILDQMLVGPPALRGSAESLLRSPMFDPKLYSPDTAKSLSDWLLEGKSWAQNAPLSGSEQPISSIPETTMSSRMVWNILQVMQHRERSSAGYDGLVACLPPNFDASSRAAIVDFLIGLALNTFMLSDCTVHLAISFFDKYLEQHDGPIVNDRMHVIAATCLKVASVFAEQSKEYYKSDCAVEYAEHVPQLASPQELLDCEKELVPKLEFDMYLPTVQWFVQSYLSYAQVQAESKAAKLACFVSDLALLDHDVLQYKPSLRAQCSLLLAVYSVDQAGHDITGQLKHLAYWDSHVREHVCQSNRVTDATMCLKALLRILVHKRREWKGAGLSWVETKHGVLTNSLVYPAKVPLSDILRYVLPSRSNHHHSVWASSSSLRP